MATRPMMRRVASRSPEPIIVRSAVDRAVAVTFSRRLTVGSPHRHGTVVVAIWRLGAHLQASRHHPVSVVARLATGNLEALVLSACDRWGTAFDCHSGVAQS